MAGEEEAYREGEEKEDILANPIHTGTILKIHRIRKEKDV